MEIIIRGARLPGRTFTSGNEQHDNVHVGVQVRDQPLGLVPGDTDGGEWRVEVDIVEGDFKGPAVHGKKGERFLYLTWGDVGPSGEFTMFRRAKLMLNRIDPALLKSAKRLRATVDLTDDRGGPRCARVDPPAITWVAD